MGGPVAGLKRKAHELTVKGTKSVAQAAVPALFNSAHEASGFAVPSAWWKDGLTKPFVPSKLKLPWTVRNACAATGAA